MISKTMQARRRFILAVAYEKRFHGSIEGFKHESSAAYCEPCLDSELYR